MEAQVAAKNLKTAGRISDSDEKLSRSQFAMKRGAQQSAELASYSVPFGKGANIATKVLLPGAAAAGLQGMAKDDATVGSVAKEAIGGAAGAGLVHGAGKLASGAVKLAGKAAGRAADNLATKSLRPSPSQQTKFLKETKEKMIDFIKRNKLQGSGYDEIHKAANPLQKAFDEVVTSNKLEIEPNKILSGFSDEIARLQRSIIPANKAKAEALTQIADNFINEYGSDCSQDCSCSSNNLVL
jgi:hypothetical protein